MACHARASASAHHRTQRLGAAAHCATTRLAMAEVASQSARLASLSVGGPEAGVAGAMDDEDDLVDLVDGEGGAEDEDDDLGRGSEDLATDVDASSARFDEIIGSLQDLVMDASFEERQGAFGRAHCHHFEDTDENKLVYMQLFEQYNSVLEKTIDEHLRATVDGFSMDEFVGMLSERQDELDGDVFDLLLTLSDFAAFKELMLSYKLEGEHAGLSIDAAPMHIFSEEQEDGEERPELNLAVTSMK